MGLELDMDLEVELEADLDMDLDMDLELELDMEKEMDKQDWQDYLLYCDKSEEEKRDYLNKQLFVLIILAIIPLLIFPFLFAVIYHLFT